MNSTQTQEHLLDVESHLRAAIRSASTNESPFVVSQLAKMLQQLQNIEDITKITNLKLTNLIEKNKKL